MAHSNRIAGYLCGDLQSYFEDRAQVSTAGPRRNSCILAHLEACRNRVYFSRNPFFLSVSLELLLSTYIQAQRPIFAHTPPDSGLAELMAKDRVGVVCSSDRELDIRNAMQKIAEAKITRENFESIRSDIMGSQQLEQLRDALSNNKL